MNENDFSWHPDDTKALISALGVGLGVLTFAIICFRAICN